MADLGAIAEQLDDLAEQLVDAGMDLLRDALRSGATKRPDAEKKIAQARRSVEKAAHLLRGLEADAVADADD